MRTEIQTSRRRKIVRLITRFGIGGVQRGVLETLKHADRKRFDHSVVCHKRLGEWAHRVEEMGMPIYLQKAKPVWSPYHLWKLSRLLRSINPDVMHIHMASSVIVGGTAARLAGIRRFILHYHSIHDNYWNAQNHLLNAWERYLTERANHLIAVSPAVAEALSRRMNIPLERIEVVPNAVDYDKYAGAEPLDLRAELRLAPQTPLVGLVGRLHRDKRIEDFIEAAVVMSRAGLAPSEGPAPVFVIVGGGPPHRSEHYEALVAEARPHVDVRMLGTRDDVPALMRNFDVGVLASAVEGFGNVLLEFMACDVPLVVTRIPAVESWIRQDEEGLFVPVGDPGAISAAVARLLAEEPLRQKLIRGGRACARRYSWERNQRRFEQIYGSLADPR